MEFFSLGLLERSTSVGTAKFVRVGWLLFYHLSGKKKINLRKADLRHKDDFGDIISPPEMSYINYWTFQVLSN